MLYSWRNSCVVTKDYCEHFLHFPLLFLSENKPSFPLSLYLFMIIDYLEHEQVSVAVAS